MDKLKYSIVLVPFILTWGFAYSTSFFPWETAGNNPWFLVPVILTGMGVGGTYVAVYWIVTDWIER